MSTLALFLIWLIILTLLTIAIITLVHYFQKETPVENEPIDLQDPEQEITKAQFANIAKKLQQRRTAKKQWREGIKSSPSVKLPIIVVGAGATGLPLAHALTERGEMVMVLEAGPDAMQDPAIRFWKQASDRFLPAQQSAYVEKIDYITKQGKTISFRSGKLLGGSQEIGYGQTDIAPRFNWINDFSKASAGGRWHEQNIAQDFAVVESQIGTMEMDLDSCDNLVSLFAKVFPKCIPISKSKWIGKVATVGDKVAGVYRTSAATRYRQSCPIKTKCPVERILLEGDNVVGVLTKDNQSLWAKKVIVSCGAIGTPQLLLRSGFTHPEIGQHLQTHLASVLLFKRDDNFSHIDNNFSHIDNAQVELDERFTLYLMKNYSFQDAAMNKQYLSTDDNIGCLLLFDRQPSSEGRVKLDSVEFDINRKDLSKHQEMIDKILSLPQMPEFIYPPPDYVGANDEQKHIFISNGMRIFDHWSSTCSANIDPKEGVVDGFLRIHDLNHIEICDASVFPCVPNGFPVLLCNTLGFSHIKR